MADKVVSTCASCGARLGTSANQCELCGWVVGIKDHDLREASGKDIVVTSGAEAATQNDGVQQEEEPQPGSVFCHNCGWENPSGANFCSACGAKLQKVERPLVKKAELPPELQEKVPSLEEPVADASSVAASVSKTNPLQVSMMVLSGIMVVGVLYMITVFSKRAFPITEASPPQQAEAAANPEEMQAAPLSAEMEEQIATLSAEAEQLEGEEKISKQREIINVLMSAQRFDRAAPVQEMIAEASGSAEDWYQAGHFYYDWMDQAYRVNNVSELPSMLYLRTKRAWQLLMI